MKNFIRAMKALSESNRVKILKILQRRNLCVCEMQAILDIAQPTVSSHLKVLEDAGLVSYQKDGFWANYRLAAGDTPYAAVMLGALRHWLNDVPEVAQLLRKAVIVSRKELKETSGKRM